MFESFCNFYSILSKGLTIKDIHISKQGPAGYLSLRRASGAPVLGRDDGPRVRDPPGIKSAKDPLTGSEKRPPGENSPGKQTHRIVVISVFTEFARKHSSWALWWSSSSFSGDTVTPSAQTVTGWSSTRLRTGLPFSPFSRKPTAASV